MTVVEVYYFSEMDKLPLKSSYNFRKGIWFVFEDGTNRIRLWGSNLNGKERFYYNEVLLSEVKRMTKLSARYEHRNENNDHYVVELKLMNLKGARTHCDFYKNDQLEQRFEFGISKNYSKSLRKIIYASLGVTLITTILIKLQDLSNWWYAVPVILSILISYMLMRKTPMLELIDTTEFIED